jgi:hypothetical protein
MYVILDGFGRVYGTVFRALVGLSGVSQKDVWIIYLNHSPRF